MLAPIITEIAWAKVSKPAFTKKETVITVVAEELCTVQVIKVPVSIPVNRLVVIAPKMSGATGVSCHLLQGLTHHLHTINEQS